MLITTVSGASASTVSPAHTTPSKSTTQPAEPNSESQNPPQQHPPENSFSEDSIRHMLFGTIEAVQQTVRNLHSRGYAEPNDWSPAISTGRAGEVMKILIKHL